MGISSWRAIQAKKPCLDSAVAPTGDDISVSTSTCSPEVKVKLITSILQYSHYDPPVFFIGINTIQEWYQKVQYWYSFV